MPSGAWSDLTDVQGGTVVNADHSFASDVLIEGSKIAAVGKGLKVRMQVKSAPTPPVQCQAAYPDALGMRRSTHCAGQAPQGATVLDASGKLVIPGGIDPHTHLGPFLAQAAAEEFYRQALKHVAVWVCMRLTPVSAATGGGTAASVRRLHDWMAP